MPLSQQLVARGQSHAQAADVNDNRVQSPRRPQQPRRFCQGPAGGNPTFDRPDWITGRRARLQPNRRCASPAADLEQRAEALAGGALVCGQGASALKDRQHIHNPPRPRRPARAVDERPAAAPLGPFRLCGLDPMLRMPRPFRCRRYSRLARIDARPVFPAACALFRPGHAQVAPPVVSSSGGPAAGLRRDARMSSRILSTRWRWSGGRSE